MKNRIYRIQVGILELDMGIILKYALHETIIVPTGVDGMQNVSESVIYKRINNWTVIKVMNYFYLAGKEAALVVFESNGRSRSGTNGSGTSLSNCSKYCFRLGLGM
jgi:hypothetical protein